LRAAAQEAHLHGAQAFELEALTRLCELPAVHGDDAQSLRMACASLPDGFDDGLAQAARSALAR
jgi:hypothetical protein